MKRYWIELAAAALAGLCLGGAVMSIAVEKNERSAYNMGMEDGCTVCGDAKHRSRLERAHKWLTE